MTTVLLLSLGLFFPAQDTALWDKMRQLEDQVNDLQERIAELEELATLAEKGAGPQDLMMMAAEALKKGRAQADDERAPIEARIRKVQESTNKKSQEVRDRMNEKHRKMLADAEKAFKDMNQLADKLEGQAEQVQSNGEKKDRYKKDAKDKRAQAKKTLQDAQAQAGRFLQQETAKAEREVENLQKKAEQETKEIRERADAAEKKRMDAAERRAEHLRAVAKAMTEEGLPAKSSTPEEEERFREYAGKLRSEGRKLEKELSGVDGQSGLKKELEEARKKLNDAIKKR